MQFRDKVFLLLAGVFISALVACNLIFQKFFTWTPLGLYTFEMSVGILPYPVTFLATDLISELYGKKKADQVVITGFAASLFVMAIVAIAMEAPQTTWSPVDDATFKKVFGLYRWAVPASMAAYLTAQFIDIRIFHFWKRVTRGRHLWLRNNGSTVVSQFVDTLVVLLLLCATGTIEWKRLPGLLENGFLFKVLVALCDTPIFYLGVLLLKRRVHEDPEEARWAAAGQRRRKGREGKPPGGPSPPSRTT